MMIDRRKLQKLLDEAQGGRILIKREDGWGHSFIHRDNITTNELISYINHQIDLGFLSFRINDVEPISDNDCREIMQHMLKERIDDLDNSDLCGAPWARVELRYLKSVYAKLDGWCKK